MWEILIFKWFLSAAENSYKFQKTKFWKEKSVEDVVTLGGQRHRPHLVYFTIYFLQLIIKVTHGWIVVVDQWWESQLVVDVTVADQWATINLLLMIVYGHPKALILSRWRATKLTRSGMILSKEFLLQNHPKKWRWWPFSVATEAALKFLKILKVLYAGGKNSSLGGPWLYRPWLWALGPQIQ